MKLISLCTLTSKNNFKVLVVSIQAISVVYAQITFHYNINKQLLYLSL